MKKANRNAIAILGILSSFVVAVMGVETWNTASKGVAEDNATMTVDRLGNLAWTEVVGATGYTLSYTFNGETPVRLETETNCVNVGMALTKAAQAAVVANNADSDTTNDTRASVQFRVKANGVSGATEMIYTHTFSHYIDYGYTMHDLADVKAQASGATRLSELTLDGSLSNWISSAVFKNDVLTIGMRIDETLDATGMNFALFGDYSHTAGNYNYRISQKMDGGVSLYIKTAENEVVVAGNDYNTPIETGKNYYLQMAVFDTYDMTGAIAGETVYYSRSEYDENSDNPLRNTTTKDNAVYYGGEGHTGSQYPLRLEDCWWYKTAQQVGLRVLVNNSWSGDRVSLRGLQRCEQLHSDVLNAEPDIIAVYLGTNDYNHALSVEDFYEKYAEMVKKITTRYTAKVFLLTVLPNGRCFKLGRTLEQLPLFNQQIKKIAKQYGCTVVDLYEDSGITEENYPQYTFDGDLHPNVEGHARMAKCVIEKMKSSI